MKSNYKLALAVLAGVVIGATIIQGLHAQQAKPLPAYVIGNVDVTDPTAYQKYAQATPATLVPYHARFIVRNGKTTVFDGETPKRVVVIAFDSMEDAVRWHESEALQKIQPLLQQSGKYIQRFAVEGVSP